MIAGIAETYIRKIFYDLCKKWCLGVSLIYTGIVFTETARDMAIINRSSDIEELRQHETCHVTKQTMFVCGGVSLD
jgi:hypothetical protein